MKTQSCISKNRRHPNILFYCHKFTGLVGEQKRVLGTCCCKTSWSFGLYCLSRVDSVMVMMLVFRTLNSSGFQMDFSNIRLRLDQEN